jgi:predicted GIY-YIG superfamily endonuclease
MSYVYLLECDDKSTYVGATVDLDRRLRQHNKEIKGGARATNIKAAKGLKWHRRCYVSGFPDWKAALQFEWAWKFQSRKLSQKLIPIERRKLALNNLLELDRPTSAALLYTEWELPINVVWSDV